ncbi:MAG TPA: hypothetical protein VGK92_05145, partial [Gaiellales bacterium]
WEADGEGKRRWATQLVAATLIRRGEYAAARAQLESLLDTNLFLGRELEQRCELVAAEGAWDEAPAVLAAARRHAAHGRLVALALHADRLDGRLQLASGEPRGALPPLERALAGFGALGAEWEGAVTGLALGETLAALGRDGEAEASLTVSSAVFERLRVPRELAAARTLLGALGTAREPQPSRRSRDEHAD